MAPKIDGSAPVSAEDLGNALSDGLVATVRLGEATMQQVAARLGLDADGLCEANPHIPDPANLKVGQELRLPEQNSPTVVLDGPIAAPHRGPVLLDDPIAKAQVQSQLRADTPATGGVASFAPNKKHEQWLNDLATFPGEAHKAWKKLGEADRAAVLSKMEARYGKDFKNQFLDLASKGKGVPETATYSNSPTSKFPMITDEQLKARGYMRAGSEATGNAGWNIELWVNPAGRMIRRDVSTYQFGKGDGGKPGTKPGGTEGPGEVVDPGDVDEEDQQDRAVHLLDQAQDGLREARELMTHKPVPWDEVNAAMMRSWTAQTELDWLMGDDPDESHRNANPPDMSKVFPNFQQERDAVAQDYHRLYTETERLNPPDPVPEMPPASGQ